MSFLQQTSGQAREAFITMPMQSRVISVMLVAAIAIGLTFLVRGDDSTGKELLFGGRSFGEQELDSVEMAFSHAGLNDWEREGRRIKIPRETKAEYLAALKDSAQLPMSLRSSVQDAINAASVFDSTHMQDTRVMHAKEQDLGNKIGTFPDVRWASVEYDRGERQGFSRSRPQSASVMVVPEGTSALPVERIENIKQLIRGSYADMSIDDVVVIDTNSTSASGHLADEDPLVRKQREVETRIEQKVRSLLVGFPALIAVSAEIDPTMDVELTSVKFDPEPTNLSNRTRKIESSNNRQPNRGVPGTMPNALGNRPASIDSDLETTTSTEDERETRGVAGQQYENSRLASLQVKTVRVSVMLPVSYYEQLHAREFLKKEPNKAEADIPAMDDVVLEQLKIKTKKNIQSSITVLLPEVSAGADRFPLVEVTDYPDLPVEPFPEPDTAKLALTWLADSWQTITLVMLALVALLVARSAAHSSGDSTPTEFNEGFGLKIPTPPPEFVNPEEEGESMTITGESLKDELLTLVEGNPEVAANVIRGWVGDAA